MGYSKGKPLPTPAGLVAPSPESDEFLGQKTQEQLTRTFSECGRVHVTMTKCLFRYFTGHLDMRDNTIEDSSPRKGSYADTYFTGITTAITTTADRHPASYVIRRYLTRCYLIRH